jgi:hypothetical protein
MWYSDGITVSVWRGIAWRGESSSNGTYESMQATKRDFVDVALVNIAEMIANALYFPK